MRQNYSSRGRNNGSVGSGKMYYNVPLLHRYREAAGLSVNGVGVAVGMNPDTCSRLFKGKGSYKQLDRVATFLKADWLKLHDRNIRTKDELDRAVFSRKAVRSSGSARVGVSQTRSGKRGGTYTAMEG